MNISEAINTLNAEKEFRRTPTGRSLTEVAIENIEAALEDKKNYGAEVVKCLGCGFIISSLLTPSGCPNCNSKDMSRDVSKAELL